MHHFKGCKIFRRWVKLFINKPQIKLLMKHLTLCNRSYISLRLKQGDSIRRIAKDLGFCHSSISREIKRNTGKKGYRHKQANDFAMARKKNKKKPVKLTKEVIAEIVVLLKNKYSPEQISGRWKFLDKISISHQSIYRYLKSTEGQVIRYLLTREGKKYRKKYGGKDYQGVIPERTDIKEREAIVDKKIRIGDWEADLVSGSKHKGYILTLVERKSRLLLASNLLNKRSKEVFQSILELLSGVKEKVWTITFDNGREFSEHYRLKDALGCKTYFSEPYSSWQRGCNENTNGLLRRYFPKTMKLDKIEKSELLRVVGELNHRPRKCLGYRTPMEVFSSSIESRLDFNQVVHL